MIVVVSYIGTTNHFGDGRETLSLLTGEEPDIIGGTLIAYALPLHPAALTIETQLPEEGSAIVGEIRGESSQDNSMTIVLS